MEKTKQFDRALSVFANQLASLQKSIDREQVKCFSLKLHQADKKGKYTYVGGAGRSGLVGEAFVERLSNLGYNVFFIGRTGTPGVGEGDSVILISGSGETSITISTGKAALKEGGKVFAVTARSDSSLAKLADFLLEIPSKHRMSRHREYLVDQVKGSYAPLAPLGTLFELSAYAVLDSLISTLARLKGISESEMRKRHYEY